MKVTVQVVTLSEDGRESRREVACVERADLSPETLGLSLLKSSLRKSPLLKDGEYRRLNSEDDRFLDYFGTIQSIVTSSATNDSGMFETNLSDGRFLPFEGAGAESKWKLELPASFRQFDYNTISKVRIFASMPYRFLQFGVRN